jgi:NAD+ synthase (glutamine-hydrolysing)
MKIAMAQINTIVGDIRGNCARVLSEIERARGMGADLAIFPELCLTGYPPRDLLGMHGFVESNLKALGEISSHVEQMGVIVGFVDVNKGEGKEFFNAAAFMTKGKVQAIIHKTLLPTYDVFDEDRYFERAREVPLVHFCGRAIGISICEDAWNAQGFQQKRLYHIDPIQNLANKGADLLINISASPFEMEKPHLRFQMLQSQARGHGIPFLYLNLVGGNDDILFDGNSLAFGRKGNLIAQGSCFSEDLFLVDPDSEADYAYRRPEDMEILHQALVMGVRDYAQKCGFKSAVLGLSGGIDSAVTACIAVKALGRENVTGVFMPSVYSAQESHNDAHALAQNLGIPFHVIPIHSVFHAYQEALAEVFKGLPADATEENVQARIRGTILMALSNKYGHLVLSTGNKSEVGVGYCTLYGDMAGGLAVISDVTKTTVYKLAQFINKEREVIPQNTIRRAPTAELRPNQTDQDSLPEYDILDEILRLRIEERMSAEEIVNHGFEAATVHGVLKMIHRNEYKRRQAAPGLKVTMRAFGTGRRMPIAMRPNY